MYADSILQNLKNQLDFYRELLVLADTKSELLNKKNDLEESIKLRQIVKEESLILAELEELERERLNFCRGQNIIEIENSLEEAKKVEFLAIRTTLKDVAIKLKERNIKNQSALEFSLKLVNKMIKVVRDLSTKEAITYSRIKRKPGLTMTPGLNLSI